MVCRRRCEAHPVPALGPFPPLQPYPVQGMRPLLTPTLIAFSRLGCGAFWVGAGIFFMAINQKQQCRFIKKLYQATQEIFFFPTLKVQDTGIPRSIRTRNWVCGMDSMKMANTGNSLVLFPSSAFVWEMGLWQELCRGAGERENIRKTRCGCVCGSGGYQTVAPGLGQKRKRSNRAFSSRQASRLGVGRGRQAGSPGERRGE